MNRKCVLDSVPKRIVSLVPSQSELLWDLGLQNQLVGITKFCIYPNEMFQSIPKIGGTKNLSVDKILQLNPDLIIGNKEENTQEQILELEKQVPVWMSDVNTLDDAEQLITELGLITATQSKASEIVFSTQKFRASFKNRISSASCIYLIWNNPFYAVGKSTFIDAMLHELGFTNLITDERYPEITLEKINKIKPDYLFLSTEPFPFTNEIVHSIQQKLEFTQVKLVNGEFFSWYGSRIGKSENYFNQFFRELHHK